MNQSFPKALRLLKSAQYRAHLEGCAGIHSSSLVLKIRPSASESTRLGLVVSRKVGNSVIRNRVKRFLRESFRVRIQGQIDQAIDIVAIAKPQAALESQSELEAQLVGGIARWTRSVEKKKVDA